LRRGLWSLAAQGLGTRRSGSAFEHLIATSGDVDAPADLSARADEYLYGGGYAARKAAKGRVKKASRKRARAR
jgi:hypothetical protein